MIDHLGPLKNVNPKNVNPKNVNSNTCEDVFSGHVRSMPCHTVTGLPKNRSDRTGLPPSVLPDVGRAAFPHRQPLRRLLEPNPGGASRRDTSWVIRRASTNLEPPPKKGLSCSSKIMEGSVKLGGSKKAGGSNHSHTKAWWFGGLVAWLSGGGSNHSPFRKASSSKNGGLDGSGLPPDLHNPCWFHV